MSWQSHLGPTLTEVIDSYPPIPFFVPTTSDPFPHTHSPSPWPAPSPKTPPPSAIPCPSSSLQKHSPFNPPPPYTIPLLSTVTGMPEGPEGAYEDPQEDGPGGHHRLSPRFPLSCMLSTHSSPASPSHACFPPTPAPLPPLLHAFHPLQPRFPLSCMLSTHASPASPSPACFPPTTAPLPTLMLLSTHASPASPSPACFPPTPGPLPPLLPAFFPRQPRFPLSCMLSTDASPASPSPACFPPTPALLPPLLHAFHPCQPRFPLSCMLSTHASPASPSPACFPPTPAPLSPLQNAFPPPPALSQFPPFGVLSIASFAPKTHFLGSCSWFQVHTALAIPPHDKMEWTSRGQFVKASPGEKNFSSVAINPAGKGSPWYGRCLVLFHYSRDGELRRGAYVEYYTEDKRLCPSTGCKRLLPTEGEDNFAVIDVDCILSLVHIVPSCEDDEVSLLNRFVW
ncbi:unnamed protein product [Closterium sp. NIES-64]|nr:unnamed protein product [Closterium sp. NIES-64]